MSKPVRKISRSRSARSQYTGAHRFEHWLISNQVYFITARCKDKFPAFNSEEAKQIFWDRFEHYTKEFAFDPWIASLMDNHYHFARILRVGDKLPKLMQRLHGSVAKLVNDTLEIRLLPFWKREGSGILRRMPAGREAGTTDVRIHLSTSEATWDCGRSPDVSAHSRVRGLGRRDCSCRCDELVSEWCSIQAVPEMTARQTRPLKRARHFFPERGA
ncbi:hypothetical protein BH09PLA1_BH09PLA1_34380 [soil metagenome]